MSEAAQIECACGKSYKWKPELAGKRGRCKCGAVLSFPKDAPQAPDEDSYDLADVPPPPVLVGAPASIVERPAAPAIRSASGIAPSKVQAAKSYNWTGAIWPVLFALAMAGMGTWHLLTPHDPHEESGRRRFWRLVIEWIYDLGGNIAVVGTFFVLCILGLLYAYSVVTGSIADSDE